MSLLYPLTRNPCGDYSKSNGIPENVLYIFKCISVCSPWTPYETGKHNQLIDIQYNEVDMQLTKLCNINLCM